MATLRLRKFDDTALFVEHVTRFTSEDDCRFDYLHDIARSFKLMDASEVRYHDYKWNYPPDMFASSERYELCANI